MVYSDFVRCAIQEDKRNVFGENNVAYSMPESMISFYRKYDPIDVEVTFPNIGAVRFCAAEELTDLRDVYHLPSECFAFATCNGDPIFLREEKVFTSIPEVFRPELLAPSFDEFLNTYIYKKR